MYFIVLYDFSFKYGIRLGRSGSEQLRRAIIVRQMVLLLVIMLISMYPLHVQMSHAHACLNICMYKKYFIWFIIEKYHSKILLSQIIFNIIKFFFSVYDITKRSTFLSLQKWIEEVRRYTSSNVIVSLIGNKCDLTDQREVEPDEPKSFCRYVPEIMFVLETSAKDNTNVEDTFRGLATELKVVSI